MSYAKDVTLSFKLPYSLKQQIKLKAKLANCSQTDFLNLLITEKLADFNPQPIELGTKYKKLITHNTEL